MASTTFVRAIRFSAIQWRPLSGHSERTQSSSGSYSLKSARVIKASYDAERCKIVHEGHGQWRFKHPEIGSGARRVGR